MTKNPYDKVRKIEQREGLGVEHDMGERVENFQKAMKTPTKRIGEKRSQRKPDVSFSPPERAIMQRFEQLSTEDYWSKTKFPSGKISSTTRITVQDPNDLDDVALPHITVEDPDNLEERAE